MYFLGEGVEKDIPEAYYWLTIASAQLNGASQEQETVKYFLKEAGRSLSDEDIAQIERRASEFLPD